MRRLRSWDEEAEGVTEIVETVDDNCSSRRSVTESAFRFRAETGESKGTEEEEKKEKRDPEGVESQYQLKKRGNSKQ